eukprot:COSAG02_NODE_898_length_16108_cov_5.877444_17_plen_61_part_00
MLLAMFAVVLFIRGLLVVVCLFSLCYLLCVVCCELAPPSDGRRRPPTESLEGAELICKLV